MILLQKWAKHKVKSYNYCANQFFRDKRLEKWNQEYKQKNLFYSVFVLFLIFWPLELRKIP